MTPSDDALRTLARHSSELDRASSEINTRRDEEHALARRALEQAETGVRQAEQQQRNLTDAIDELATVSGTVGAERPASAPKQAEIRADLDRLKNTWPTFRLLQASEQMERDDRRSMAAGRTIEWVWLGLAAVGALALVVAPIIIVSN